MIKTRKGLAGILSNPVYLGWYCYSKPVPDEEQPGKMQRETIVLSKEAHEPIVAYDEFLYAFSRLSNYTLEGEDNPHKPVVNRTFQTTQALLESILTGYGSRAYVNSTLYRVVRDRNTLAKPAHSEINIPVKVLDDAFANVFVEVLIGIKQAAENVLASLPLWML